MPKRQAGEPAAASDMAPSARLRAGSDTAAQPLATPARKRFDALIERLERTREELRDWREALPRWEQRFHAQVEPLLQARDAAQAQLVHDLDDAHAMHKLGKRERADVSETLCALAAPLLEQPGFDALKPIHARHRGAQGEGGDSMQDAAMQAALAAEFGLTIEELQHLPSPETLYAQLQQRQHQQQAHTDGRAQRHAKRRRAGAGPAAASEFDPQQARRALYRSLVAALHPDREPDARQRERKTALMQELNRVYRQDDLLGLLELQLEIGQLDHAGIASMAEERIGDYAAMFATQLQQVERELAQVVDAFVADYGLALERRPQPRRLDALMAQIKRQLQDEIAYFDEDRRALQQPSTLKQWLREQRAAFEAQDAAAAACVAERG
ncbi:J domain-containing protein [Xanthomonas campestris pv. cannae]|nr:J domain-containing protein [Xanthomonas campestris pv. cannae]